MTDNSKAGVVIEAPYQFLAWLLSRIEKFSKSHKFTIGDCIAGYSRMSFLLALRDIGKPSIECPLQNKKSGYLVCSSRRSGQHF